MAIKKNSSNDPQQEFKSPKTGPNSKSALQMSETDKTPCCGGSTKDKNESFFAAEKPGCCMSTSSTSSKTELKKGPKTRIVVRYNVGFHNFLTLRGKGCNLNWDKGIPLKNIKADEWVWETEMPFNSCEFKVLINDHQYEIGENHPISCGASIQYTPKF